MAVFLAVTFLVVDFTDEEEREVVGAPLLLAVVFFARAFFTLAFLAFAFFPAGLDGEAEFFFLEAARLLDLAFAEADLLLPVFFLAIGMNPRRKADGGTAVMLDEWVPPIANRFTINDDRFP